MDALEIQNICVRNGALDLEVGMAIDTLHVTEEQANRILELLPNLANHVCVNGAGDGSFGDEIVGTELAHLLEHVIIELQGKAAPAGPPACRAHVMARGARGNGSPGLRPHAHDGVLCQ